jgi:hypothetical protein
MVFFDFIRPSQSNPQWVFLGILTNEKPSAIFKISGNKNAYKSMDELMDEDGPFQASTSQTVAQIGISIEPIQNVVATQQSHVNLVVVRNTINPSPNQIATKLLESI